MNNTKETDYRIEAVKSSFSINEIWCGFRAF